MVKSMHVTVNVMVKGMSQSMLWSKVCHSQCYGQKYVSFYVTVNIMVKCMSQSVLWAKYITVNAMVKVCHSQCCGIKYVTAKCHCQKFVCHS